MRKLMLSGLVLGFAIAILSACETVKGVGRDIENAGEALDEAVDE